VDGHSGASGKKDDQRARTDPAYLRVAGQGSFPLRTVAVTDERVSTRRTRRTQARVQGATEFPVLSSSARCTWLPGGGSK
jgi:hypothetical protein